MINRDTYKELYRQIPRLPIFFHPWYLDACCGNNWDVILSYDKGQSLVGILPYFKSTKYGISHITMPLLAPYLGPWIIYPQQSQKPSTKISYEKKVITDLLSRLPQTSLTKMHCHPSLSNILPAHWLGYDVKTRYTYLLKKQSQEELLANIDAKQRNIIRSKGSDFDIIESDDITAFYELNSKSFDRQNLKVLYSLEYLTSIYRAAKKHQSSKIMFAKKDESLHAGILTVWDENSTYCLAIGNNPLYKNSGALSVLMHQVILDSFDRTDIFNFEGGMIPNIEKFFRSFGGQLTPYHRIEKAQNRFLKGVFHWMGKI